jgi:hypothetical protein
MDTWVGGTDQATEGKLYLWWAQASAYHKAVAAWYKHIADNNISNITTTILYPTADADNGCT